MSKSNVPDIAQDKELQVLLNCVSGRPVSQKQFDALDPERFLQLAETHRMFSALGQCCNALPDSELTTRIRENHRENKLNQLVLINELAAISGWFKPFNYVVFKGPVLSQLLYNDPAERTSWDLDILIDIRDFDTCLTILKEHGYEPVMKFHTPKQKEAIKRHYHHLDVYNKNNGVLIELHWKLTAIRGRHVELRDVLKHSQQVNLNNISFQTLDFASTCEYLAIHGTFHSFFRLQWLFDLYTLLRNAKENDLNALRQRIDENDTTLFLQVALRLTEHYFRYIAPTQLQQVSSSKKVDQLCLLAHQEIHNSNLKIKKSRWKTMIHNHRVQYYTGGLKGLFKSIFSRNVRPANWSFFAFPDAVFFLNHLFSRVIWIIGKMAGKL